MKINIEKPKYVLKKIKGLLKQIRSTIRDLVSVFGTFDSFIPALPFNNVKYRNLEKEKTSLNVKNKTLLQICQNIMMR